MLLQVDSNSVRRMKSHVLEFFAEPSIGCILGTNSYVWIHSKCGDNARPHPIERKLMAILRNSIVALDKAKLPIYRETIMKVLDMQAETEIEAKDILSNIELMTSTAKQLTESELSQNKPINF